MPLPQNPVIPLDAGERGERKLSSAFPECVIFDPSGWKEGDTYYALVGNKNFRPGYEGDCTSLFKSRDLANWEYVGPFYRSQRRWTAEEEDCACSDFFPFGDRHMLLMHTHRPYGYHFVSPESTLDDPNGFFVNSRQCVALRAYPGRTDSTGVSLRSQGGDIRLVTLDMWQMDTVTAEVRVPPQARP